MRRYGTPTYIHFQTDFHSVDTHATVDCTGRYSNRTAHRTKPANKNKERGRTVEELGRTGTAIKEMGCKSQKTLRSTVVNCSKASTPADTVE